MPVSPLPSPRGSGEIPLRAPATPSSCAAEEGYKAAFGGRRTFYLKPDQLNAIKAVRDSDPVVARAYAALIARARCSAPAQARRGDGQDDHAAVRRPARSYEHRALLVARSGRPQGPYIRRDGEVRSAARYERL